MLKRINYLAGIFHAAIIAMFFLSVNGCGYKADPYYLQTAPLGDENVEFIIKNPSKEKTEEKNEI